MNEQIGDKEYLLTCGGGLLATLLGALLLRGGQRAIITRRATIDDEDYGRRELRGCSAVLNGLSQFFFGLLLLVGGLGMLALNAFMLLLWAL